MALNPLEQKKCPDCDLCSSMDSAEMQFTAQTQYDPSVKGPIWLKGTTILGHPRLVHQFPSVKSDILIKGYMVSILQLESML